MAFPFVDRRRLSGWLRRSAILRWALKTAARALTMRHYVGAVVAVFDEAGRVLIVEHVFRTDHPWGLPGGWVSRGEAPGDAVVREVREELDLTIEVHSIVAVGRIPSTNAASHPAHLGVAYYATLTSPPLVRSREILAFRWADPDSIGEDLAPFQRQAISAAKVVRVRDRGDGRGRFEVQTP